MLLGALYIGVDPIRTLLDDFFGSLESKLAPIKILLDDLDFPKGLPIILFGDGLNTSSSSSHDALLMDTKLEEWTSVRQWPLKS